VARSRGSGRVQYRLQYWHTVRTCTSTSITIGPSLTGLRDTQLMSSIIHTLVNEGQAEYHFAIFSLCSKQTNNFQCIITHDLFVCVTFHVVIWLLSSIVRIISFMTMFTILWSQLAMLYNNLIKIVLAACHLKNYFCYHSPTRGRAGIKLGDADTLQTYL
jgi:hypothetical protein